MAGVLVYPTAVATMLKSVRVMQLAVALSLWVHQPLSSLVLTAKLVCSYVLVCFLVLEIHLQVDCRWIDRPGVNPNPY